MKTLLLSLIFPVIGYSQRQKVLQLDYSLPLANNEVTKLHQNNDTLYDLRCYFDKPCQSDPFRHYKIISSNKDGEFDILKLEQLDTIPYPANSLSKTRYSVVVLKGMNSKQLSYLTLTSGLTQQQLDTLQINVQSSEGRFFFTFFSNAYIKELSALKTVSTKSEAKEIVEAFRNSNFKLLQANLGKAGNSEAYITRYIAELINRICIEKGFNPIGAGQIIEQLMK